MKQSKNTCRKSGLAAAAPLHNGKPGRRARTGDSADGRRKKGPRKILTGLRFGRLLVLSLHGQANGGSYLWLCRCDCGNTLAVLVARLSNGQTRSCGCLQRERVSETMFKHGRSNTPAQSQWSGMKARCYYPPHKQYADYGGRGITVCKRWRDSFLDFVADMGERPPGMSIERIDNDGNYEPGNCRWATQREQCANTRRNRNLLFRGESLCVSEWTRRLGFKNGLIMGRLIRNWPVDKILTTPPRASARWPQAKSTVAI